MNNIKNTPKHNNEEQLQSQLLRVDKIVMALYMVTDFIDDREPLKFKLRNLGLEIVSLIKKNYSDQVANFFGTPGSGYSRYLVAEKITGEIVSLLDIAGAVGIISEMNYLILKNEFMAIQKVLVAYQTNGQQKIEEVLKDKNNSLLLNKGQNYKRQENVPYNKPYVPKKNVNYNLVGTTAKKENKKNNSSGRKEIILNLIREKKEVGIKDICLLGSPLISGCSEKTIQRELTAFVQDGVLTKIGDKRWSRYILKK
jgi:hypothetical protein